MMNIIWVILIILSFFCAVAQNSIGALSQAVTAGGTDAITLVIKLAGALCFWNGIMAVAEKSGFTEIICRLLSPVIKLIFPHLDDKKAKNAISMNITANLLGLGSAATPLGIEAMKRLKAHSLCGETATDDMVRFVVINSAAVHLVPSTVALLRREYGSTSPVEIMLPALLTSLIALTGGLIMTKILEKPFKERTVCVRKSPFKKRGKI